MEAHTVIATHAADAKTDTLIRPDFELTREIPKNLRGLEEVSRNFYWSWRPAGTALFRDLDAALWDRCEQNPRLFLRQIQALKLFQRSTDRAFIDRLDDFFSEQTEYLSRRTQSLSTDQNIAYFCAEYGVHHSLPNYSGGLGILAGDHLKSASDLNLPLTAVGLFYRYGYFRQKVGHDGWQKESYHDNFLSEMALTPVFDQEGKRITVAVHIRGREVTAQAWHAAVGRISLYLLDTNLEENSEVDRLITGHLYGGDTETRIVQEKVLGIGGIRLLRKLGITPTVFHLNEGHSAFLTLELAKEHLEKNPDDNFGDAVVAVQQQCVFTTHTPVAAGNDLFEPQSSPSVSAASTSIHSN